jgi:hypothetical protein
MRAVLMREADFAQMNGSRTLIRKGVSIFSKAGPDATLTLPHAGALQPRVQNAVVVNNLAVDAMTKKTDVF